MNRNTLLLLLAGLLLLGGGGVALIFMNWKNSANAQKWLPFLNATENEFNLPTDLLARIAYQESRFRDDVISGTQTSSAGALGMMQLMPAYFETVNRPVPFSDSDTQDQILQAAQLLAQLYTQFGTWERAVAAYNTGAGNLTKILAGTAMLPAETSAYLAQVFADVPNAGTGVLA